jgi:hypothetical protein
MAKFHDVAQVFGGSVEARRHNGGVIHLCSPLSERQHLNVQNWTAF